ncbi:putative nuclease HARBI1 [Aphidius gifuensis]|uniref:putative nuclease HARBI1 n=1 Tax=Aphidius gifuensis TaxID=684658 RepID=UPI001CDC308D|nr:putative nuclease HARBI1 [Aphidius gifuensis]
MPIVLAQPTTAGWIQIAETFECRWKFPHCIGAMDGKHIRIKAPPNSGSKYFNYKLFHSIILLAICDAKYCFTLVDIGANGRQSDGGVFSRSIMGRRFENGSMGVPPPAAVTGTQTILPYVLVADQAFSLAPYLLRPYPDRSGLNYTKRIFNYRLSSVRRIIENTFGILQARWQVFWGPIGGNIDTTKAIVAACVCLHNFLMKGDKTSRRNFYFDSTLVDTETNDGEIVPGAWRNQIPMQSDDHNDENSLAIQEFPMQSEEIRQRFAEFLEDEGAVPWQFWRMYL